MPARMHRRRARAHRLDPPIAAWNTSRPRIQRRGGTRMTMTAFVTISATLLTFAALAQAADPPAGKSPAAGKSPGGPAAASKAPVVVMKTSMGEVKIELEPDKAPISVKNFLEYVEAKQYDGTIFHRVI